MTGTDIEAAAVAAALVAFAEGAIADAALKLEKRTEAAPRPCHPLPAWAFRSTVKRRSRNRKPDSPVEGNRALTCIFVSTRRALGGTRTPNLLIRSQVLYPLSYERWPYGSKA